MCAEERVRVAPHCRRPEVSSVCAEEREGSTYCCRRGLQYAVLGIESMLALRCIVSGEFLLYLKSIVPF